MPRLIHNSLGFTSLLFGVVAAAGVAGAPPQPIGGEPAAADRRSDLAGLRTLHALGAGSGLSTSESGEVAAQLARLDADEGAELDVRRRVKLAGWLRAAGISS